MKLIYLFGSDNYAIAIIKLGRYYRYEIISSNQSLKAFKGAYDDEREALREAREFVAAIRDR